MKEELKNIIESLLFVAEDPLTVSRLKQVVDIADTTEIKNTLVALQNEYETRGGGFYLSEVADGYQIRTRPAYTQWIKRLIKPNPLRLSKAALETLAIIAYKQPLIRSDIEHIRGVDCGGVLRMLLERKLVRVLGRKEIPGRPLIYATTKHFLEVFELKNLKELPTPKEIEELGQMTDHEPAEPPENAPLATVNSGPQDGLETDERLDAENGVETDDRLEDSDTQDADDSNNSAAANDSAATQDASDDDNRSEAAESPKDIQAPDTTPEPVEKTLDLDKDPPV